MNEIRRSLPEAHRLLDGFAIRPRYALEARVVEPGEEALVGLFVTLSTRYDITAELAALDMAGVDLSGLDVSLAAHSCSCLVARPGWAR